MTEIIRSIDGLDRGTGCCSATSGGACTTGCGRSRRRWRRSSGFARGGGTGGAPDQLAAAGGRRRAAARMLGAPRSCWDVIVSSGDAAQAAMVAGPVRAAGLPHRAGARLVFFADPRGGPSTSSGCRWRRPRASSAPGFSTTGTETPEDYRATILYGKVKGLKLLCANPDIVVDVGDIRIWCAGAIAAAYTEAGGRSYYFGKPHPPIYGLARRKLAELTGFEPVGRRDPLPRRRDRHGHPGRNGRGAGLRSSSPAASRRRRPGRPPAPGPDPALLAAYLAEARLAPRLAMAYLR